MSHPLRVPARRRRRGRPNLPDYIETKHLYHPETGELLGVLAAEGIPTDPKKLPAFVKRKAKAAAPRNAISILSGNGDGWDQLRNHDFWPNLRDHRFWKKLQTEFKRLPYGVSADATGLCDSGKSIATSSLGRQLARDAFTRLGLSTHANLITKPKTMITGTKELGDEPTVLTGKLVADKAPPVT